MPQFTIFSISLPTSIYLILKHSSNRVTSSSLYLGATYLLLSYYIQLFHISNLLPQSYYLLFSSGQPSPTVSHLQNSLSIARQGSLKYSFLLLLNAVGGFIKSQVVLNCGKYFLYAFLLTQYYSFHSASSAQSNLQESTRQSMITKRVEKFISLSQISESKWIVASHIIQPMMQMKRESQRRARLALMVKKSMLMVLDERLQTLYLSSQQIPIKEMICMRVAVGTNTPQNEMVQVNTMQQAYFSVKLNYLYSYRLLSSIWKSSTSFLQHTKSRTCFLIFSKGTRLTINENMPENRISPWILLTKPKLPKKLNGLIMLRKQQRARVLMVCETTILKIREPVRQVVALCFYMFERRSMEQPKKQLMKWIVMDMLSETNTPSSLSPKLPLWMPVVLDIYQISISRSSANDTNSSRKRIEYECNKLTFLSSSLTFKLFQQISCGLFAGLIFILLPPITMKLLSLRYQLRKQLLNGWYLNVTKALPMKASDLFPKDYSECLIIFWLTLFIFALTFSLAFSSILEFYGVRVSLSKRLRQLLMILSLSWLEFQQRLRSQQRMTFSMRSSMASPSMSLLLLTMRLKSWLSTMVIFSLGSSTNLWLLRFSTSAFLMIFDILLNHSLIFFMISYLIVCLYHFQSQCTAYRSPISYGSGMFYSKIEQLS